MKALTQDNDKKKRIREEKKIKEAIEKRREFYEFHARKAIEEAKKLEGILSAAKKKQFEEESEAKRRRTSELAKTRKENLKRVMLEIGLYKTPEMIEKEKQEKSRREQEAQKKRFELEEYKVGLRIRKAQEKKREEEQKLLFEQQRAEAESQERIKWEKQRKIEEIKQAKEEQKAELEAKILKEKEKKEREKIEKQILEAKKRRKEELTSARKENLTNILVEMGLYKTPEMIKRNIEEELRKESQKVEIETIERIRKERERKAIVKLLMAEMEETKRAIEAYKLKRKMEDIVKEKKIEHRLWLAKRRMIEEEKEAEKNREEELAKLSTDKLKWALMKVGLYEPRAKQTEIDQTALPEIKVTKITTPQKDIPVPIPSKEEKFNPHEPKELPIYLPTKKLPERTELETNKAIEKIGPARLISEKRIIHHGMDFKKSLEEKSTDKLQFKKEEKELFRVIKDEIRGDTDIKSLKAGFPLLPNIDIKKTATTLKELPVPKPSNNKVEKKDLKDVKSILTKIITSDKKEEEHKKLLKELQNIKPYEKNIEKTKEDIRRLTFKAMQELIKGRQKLKQLESQKAELKKR